MHARRLFVSTFVTLMWSAQAVCQCQRPTTDSLADVFPLSVGNQWTYRYYLFWQNWPSGNPGETCVDSGRSVCEVTGYLRTSDSTVWQIRERRDIVRHDVIDPWMGRSLDTIYSIQDSNNFELIESHNRQHQLYRNANPYLARHEVFPFTREFVDTALIYRFAYVDAGDTIAFQSWINASPSPYFRNVFTFKKGVGLVRNEYNSGTVDVRSTHEHILITSIISSVTYQSPSEHLAFTLHQNYPNPFNPTTVISYQLPVVSNVRLGVYDLLGREVTVLVNERREAGVHQVRFDRSGLSSGVYFYRLTAGSNVKTRNFLLLR